MTLINHPLWVPLRGSLGSFPRSLLSTSKINRAGDALILWMDTKSCTDIETVVETIFSLVFTLGNRIRHQGFGTVVRNGFCNHPQ